MLYDVLESVDGFMVTGWKMENILSLLIGKEGTPVTLVSFPLIELYMAIQ